jgi:hypothetical protein
VDDDDVSSSSWDNHEKYFWGLDDPEDPHSLRSTSRSCVQHLTSVCWQQIFTVIMVLWSCTLDTPYVWLLPS